MSSYMNDKCIIRIKVPLYKCNYYLCDAFQETDLQNISGESVFVYL